MILETCEKWLLGKIMLQRTTWQKPESPSPGQTRIIGIRTNPGRYHENPNPSSDIADGDFCDCRLSGRRARGTTAWLRIGRREPLSGLLRELSRSDGDR